MNNVPFSEVTAINIKDVMAGKITYYHDQIEKLRELVDVDGGLGVALETLPKQRQSLLQGLAVDIGSDLSLLAKVRLEIAGSPYYKNILDDYSWYLKDLLGTLRLYASSERSHFV